MLEALIIGGVAALLVSGCCVSYMYGRQDGHRLGYEAGYREGFLRSARL